MSETKPTKMSTEEWEMHQRELRRYSVATAGMNELARHKLANYMKHGYELGEVQTVVFLERVDRREDGTCLILTKDGEFLIGHREISRGKLEGPQP